MGCWRVGSRENGVGNKDPGGFWVVFMADIPDILERFAFPDFGFGGWFFGGAF